MMQAILIALLSALPVTTQATKRGTLAERVVGSYRLVSAEGRSTDGKITYDWGQEPLGRLMLDAGGGMSIHLMNPTRRRFTSGDFLRPTPEELEEAFVGYFGYFGSYTIEESPDVLIFHVEGAAYPNYIGTDQRRFFVLDGDRLTLRTPPERAGGADITYVIIFERER
ncbi:MAG: lipocalin-like domain-containing protein [Acidobacteria bacterium]|nr:MAG: lipocalin-like domain-containing protein [Acidobacteriota bacterium]